MLQRSTKQQSAFTIVELLIVIVIIAIVAAISIVAFNGIQNRARASAASSALAQANKKLALWQIESGTNGSASADCSVFASQIGSTADASNSCVSTKDNITYQYRQGAAGTSNYCVTATSGNVSYRLDTTITSTPTSGGCAGHGVGGSDAITNLAMNPRATAYSSSTQIGWSTGRWFGGSGTPSGVYSLISGANDGPNMISTYIRKTWSNGGSTSLGASGDTGFNINGKMEVTAGSTYVISCYLRPSVTRNFQIGVYQYTDTGAASTSPREYGAVVIGQANQWTRVSHTYTVPGSGVASISFACDSSANAANGAQNWPANATLDGTGLMITKSSTLYNYADGNSDNWIWNNGINSSTSTGPAT